jgi:hypothetical protein
MMPPTGCNTNRCSLLHALPTGLSIGSTTPQTIGLVVPYTKTNRPRGYSRLLHWEGGFLPEAVLARRPPTSTGNKLWTNCGRTSAITSRWWPTNAILTRKPLVNARRPIVANNSLTSVPLTNARRLPKINGFSMKRLHVVNAFLMKRPLIALWPNTLLLHDGWWPPKPSSYGFAATASTSGSPARLCSYNNARPLSHVCNMSRTAARARHSRRSSIDRQLQRKQRLWQMRPPSNVAMRWPHGRKHWLTRLTSDNAKSRPNALRRWRSQYPPRNNVAHRSWRC